MAEALGEQVWQRHDGREVGLDAYRVVYANVWAAKAECWVIFGGFLVIFGVDFDQYGRWVRTDANYGA